MTHIQISPVIPQNVLCSFFLSRIRSSSFITYNRNTSLVSFVVPCFFLDGGEGVFSTFDTFAEYRQLLCRRMPYILDLSKSFVMIRFLRLNIFCKNIVVEVCTSRRITSEDTKCQFISSVMMLMIIFFRRQLLEFLQCKGILPLCKKTVYGVTLQDNVNLLFPNHL